MCVRLCFGWGGLVGVLPHRSHHSVCWYGSIGFGRFEVEVFPLSVFWIFCFNFQMMCRVNWKPCLRLKRSFTKRSSSRHSNKSSPYGYQKSHWNKSLKFKHQKSKTNTSWTFVPVEGSGGGALRHIPLFVCDLNLTAKPFVMKNKSLLTMKRQWTYGPTLLPWFDHFHTSLACFTPL